MTENHRALNVGLVKLPEFVRILKNNDKSQNSQEESPVSTQAVREYLILIWQQYQGSSRREKSRLLDEACKNTGRHRKSLIRLFSRKSTPRFERGKGHAVNSYSDESKQGLKKLWKDMGYMGSLRMKSALELWLPFYKGDDIPAWVLTEISIMSASTIERTLKDEKSKLRRRQNSGTKRTPNRHRTDIPIRNLEQKPDVPGHCEIDCVAHCGGSLSGEHIWTLTVTDIFSGWTECEAMRFKNGFEVKNALHRIESRLPFKLRALYMDNGSEFLNDDVKKRFAQRIDGLTREEFIQLFRSRPYKKNDQCFVEQKNFTHVRELFGYDRYSGKLLCRLMNNIYCNEWRYLCNFFHPQIRLKSKERIGSKVIKRYHAPMTPMDKLSSEFASSAIDSITKIFIELNPFDLRRSLSKKLRQFRGYQGRSKPVSKHAA